MLFSILSWTKENTLLVERRKIVGQIIIFVV